VTLTATDADGASGIVATKYSGGPGSGADVCGSLHSVWRSQARDQFLERGSAGNQDTPGKSGNHLDRRDRADFEASVRRRPRPMATAGTTRLSTSTSRRRTTCRAWLRRFP
jgi:hypothetical protein